MRHRGNYNACVYGAPGRCVTHIYAVPVQVPSQPAAVSSILTSAVEGALTLQIECMLIVFK